MYLSIIIPAHNEEHRLPDTLRQVVDFVSRQSFPCEVLVVENGSSDHTWEVIQTFAAQHPSIRGLQVQSRGKGLAVKAGMLTATGRYRFMCDADLSMPIAQVERFLPPHQPEEVAVAYASREAAGAIRYDEPAFRHWGGRLINFLVRGLALPGIQDSQCGFKCFRADAAQAIFPRQTLSGIAFDVEILYLARRMGYTIAEVPIDWYYNADSRINLLGDTLTMLRDLLAIRRNARLGVYDAAPDAS